jgi:hypothetical protein
MAPSESISRLLLDASEKIGKAASLIRMNETNKKSKDFYSEIVCECLVIHEIIYRIKSIVDEKQVVEILARLEQTVKEQISAKQIPPAKWYPRLLAFIDGWNSVEKQNDTAKLSFIAQYLDLDQDPNQREELIEYLQGWEKNMMAQYPEFPPEGPFDEFQMPKKRTSEPSYDVWKEAQSLFKALLKLKACSCHSQHEFGAGICLGTYQKPAEPQGRIDEGQFFDMFLTVQQQWHETHAYIVKKRSVNFVEDTKEKDLKGKKPAFPQTMRVKKLCEPLIKRKPSDRIRFKVDETGQLLKLRSDKGRFRTDETKEPISLQQVIQDTQRSLTDKIKRILAVLLSYAIFHLHGTPWLSSSWSSSNILFFRTTTSIIPIMPFLRTELSNGATLRNVTSQYNESIDNQLDECNPDELDPDNVDLDDMSTDTDPDEVNLHQCPSLLTLGVVLLEIYLETPFEELAKKYDLATDITCPVSVSSVFDKYKTEIPEDSQFYHAVEKCLDLTIWRDDQGERLDDLTLRSVIYQEVIQPLEENLSQGFSYIPIDQLDQFAQQIDFGDWGRRVADNHIGAQYPLPNPRDAFSPLADVHFGRRWQDQHSVQSNRHLSHGAYSSLHSTENGSYLLHRGQDESVGKFNYKMFKFFDEEAMPEDSLGTEWVSSRYEINFISCLTLLIYRSLRYRDWESKFQAVYHKFIKSPSECPIKIAILDTGIDQTHPDIDARNEQIKGTYNWVNDKFKKKVDDHHGHGTFTAALLMTYAPGAEVFVAKVCDGKAPSPVLISKVSAIFFFHCKMTEPHDSTQAVDHAINIWHVDVISMSFGFPTSEVDGYTELERSIRTAYSMNVLLFAAASNSGANQGRAYPARDQNVICIHSTNVNGSRSHFSPTAMSDRDNIATVGEAVESAWPMHLRENSNGLITKSGTSYATPIAAGMAVFLLQYARIHLPGYADRMKRQSSMKAVLRKISDNSRDGYQYVAMNLYSDNLFGKDEAFINHTLRDIITHS